MAIQRLGPDNFEQFTVELHPRQSYSSGSSTSRIHQGVTGTLRVFPRGSLIEKDVESLGAFADRSFSDDSFHILTDGIPRLASGTSDISSYMEGYLQAVNAQASSSRRATTVEIKRFEPSVRFAQQTLRKSTVRNTLFPYYSVNYPSAQWAFTNYHSLNFFTASNVPSNTALLYPNSKDVITSQGGGIASGSYALTGAFAFDFWINPRYTTDERDAPADFKAGTLFHLSSSYALSLITGSRRDTNGFPETYRLQLQLSHSADIAPSLALPGTFPADLVFQSGDNALLRNHWHHVTVRWGTDAINEGTGSFIVDGVNAGDFVVPSGTIAPLEVTASLTDPGPAVLVVGNYWEGSNGALTAQSNLFNATVAQRDGVIKLTNSSDDPADFDFTHPLNAEVHELKIYGRTLSDEEIPLLSSSSPLLSDPGLLFYVPPFFTKESPYRSVVNGRGGVLQTPFFGVNGRTDDPFNVALSFGVGGHDINLENFGRDFAQGTYPRLFNLTGSQITVTTQAKSANEFLWSTGSVRKRNLTLLPCDNGRFRPNWQLLLTGSTPASQPASGSALEKFVDDRYVLDLSLVSLNDLISTSSLRPGLVEESNNILSGVVGSSPEDPGVDPGEVLTIFQRTRDNSSNEVVFFDISNLYYGNQIQPETFELIDPGLTGSDDKIQITLRDDGFGNLYRADAETQHASWASVGNVLYHEGIAVVKDPTVPLFGSEQWSTSFQGEQRVHTLKANVVAPRGLVTSSSNPSFVPVSASLSANETDPEFVYISSVLFHDENLNVVMRANLAQPVVKRKSSKISFRVKMDW